MTSRRDRRDAGREGTSGDNRTGRALHNALGYQLRQVSRQIRELQKQAQALNIRPNEAETPKKNGADHGREPD